MLLGSSVSRGADPSPPPGLDAQSLGLEGSHGIAPPVPQRSMRYPPRSIASPWKSTHVATPAGLQVGDGCSASPRRARSLQARSSSRPRGIPIESGQDSQPDHPGRRRRPRVHRQRAVHEGEGPRHTGSPGELGSESAVSRRRGRRLQRRARGLEHGTVRGESAPHVAGQREQARQPGQCRGDPCTLTPNPRVARARRILKRRLTGRSR